MTEIKGIDISHYQNERGAIDFDKVKAAGYKFAIIKATEGSESGTAYLDESFKSNVEGANKAGLVSHAYHFFRTVSEADARAEAQWFIKALKAADVKGYVFCDVELKSLTTDEEKLTAYVNAFGDELAAAGYTRFGIYSGKYYFESRLIELKLLNSPLIWIARYNSILGRNADVWQHSSSASVPGIAGDVDVNIAYTDKVLLGKASEPSKSKVSTKPKEKKAATPDTYTVKAGDTLSEIGAKLGVNYQDIKKLNGLKSDLILPGQKLKLKKSAAKPKAPKISGSAVVPYPGHLIKKGSKGKDVERIQRALGINADGIFGKQTDAAVKAYQKRHGLIVDGIVGQETWNTLF
ncbi:GH25 family lysozyme [Sporolactobacillus terrae]|uniref:LysM domain-containing protein n=1 Tax=Sporolactobacillus terrae TaxID=269673 RepID=A0A5K7X233_9BACL|nr:GH25 family lysozyme [Sporolactobacillus terrae]BBN98740.1 hypothetical protein St703_14450 [Sporolactobacillus terrae]